MNIIDKGNCLQIEGLRQLVDNPYEAAQSWQTRTGKPVIGCFLPDVPEEIVYASGALPLNILGFPAPKSSFRGHIQEFSCSLARTSIQAILDGKFDFLSAIIIPVICDTTRALVSVWRYLQPQVRVIPLNMPKQRQRIDARNFLLKEFESLAKKVAAVTGQEITKEKLNSSIELHEQNRALLRDIFSEYKIAPDVISLPDLYGLVKAAMVLPKEDVNGLLINTREALQKVHKTKNGPDQKKSKVFVYGKLSEPIQFFEILNDLDVMVAGDTICTGSRYFSVKVYSEKNPFERLVNRELGKGPLGYHEYVHRDRYLLEKVMETGADGVIFSHLKFCELEDYDYPLLKKSLDQKSIPNTVIDTEISGSSFAQLRTWLEAFVETITGIE